MYRRSLSNDNKNYSYVPPLQQPHVKNYDPNHHTEQVLYSNTAHIPSFDSQRRSQPRLSEPISIFDDRESHVPRRYNVNSVPSGYVPPNPIQRSSVSDLRLTTANAMRQRLLTDIQDNIIEIDRELNTLEVRPLISNHLPPHFSTFTVARKPPCIHQQERALKEANSSPGNKSKKVYEVIPPKASKPIDQSTIHSFVGQYHYGAEIGESEIMADDPENTDWKSSTIEEIPKLTYETSSTEQFLRKQSPLPLDRALIFVPIHGDKTEVGKNETTADFHEKTPPEGHVDQLVIVSPLPDIISSDKLNIQDFNLLIQTAPESQSSIEPPQSSDIMNTMFSKPLKHARLSTRTLEKNSSTHPSNNNPDNHISGGFGYFFSDFGNDNEGEGEEDLISLDLTNFALPLPSEMFSGDNISNGSIRPSQTSLLNPHQQQQSIHPNSNEHVKETENKNNDVTTNDIVPAPLTSPSKQTLPISINDNTATQSTKNSNEHNQQTGKKMSNMNTTEPLKDNKLAKSSFHFNSSLMALGHKDVNNTSSKPTNVNDKGPISGNKQSHPIRQGSSSLRYGSKNQTSNIASRRPSITPPDLAKKPTNQQKPPVQPRRTSVLPVPLHSTDFINERFSTSRPTTPERRSSIPTLDPNILLTFLDMNNFDDQQTVSPQELDSLIDFASIHDQDNDRLKSFLPLTTEPDKLNENHSKHEENDLSPPIPISEELRLITPSQRRLKHRSKSKQRKGTNDNHEQHLYILFPNIITHSPMHYLNNCYRCMNTTIAKKYLPSDMISSTQPVEQIWCLADGHTDNSHQLSCRNGQLKTESQTQVKTSNSCSIICYYCGRSHFIDRPESNTEPDLRIAYSLEIDLCQSTDENGFFFEYHDSEWSNITNTTVNNYPLLFITQSSKLNDYVDEKFNDKFQEETPPNRPKWNCVSRNRSVNLIYNPKVSNSNSIRRGWDYELRRKRVHKLPALEQKRDHNEIPQLAIEAPRSHDRLAIDYTYDHSVHRHSDGAVSSGRSSRALVPLNHFPNEISSNISRSQRPIHREWYDDLNRSRLTHRTDVDRATNTSFRDSIHQTNTSRELVPLPALTRNSQNSFTSGTILDSSIRTNRATELRLSRDMDEHHQHSHDVNQSMPMEIRSFHLKGRQLTNSEDAKIRPLSNVNYQTSERVKNHRPSPWVNSYQHETSSQNSTLLPIAEFRHASFITSIEESPQVMHEEQQIDF